MIESASPKYIARSDRHFSLPLSEEQYRKVLAIVEKWRTAPQPSYRLEGRNCVTFVAEVAATLGLNAPIIPKLMKKPKSYLNAITDMNSAAIARWGQGISNAARSPSQPPATSH
jgi:hypothetical protein